MKNAENIEIFTQETKEKFEQKISCLSEENERLSAKVLYLETEYKKLQKMIFGAKTERFKEEPKEQLKLDLLPELIEEKEVEEQKITYTRQKETKKQKPIREPLPKHLKRKEEIIEPEDIPENARKIGENITEVLEYEPGKIYVRRIVRPKYVIDNPQKTEEFDSDRIIVTADMPSDLPLLSSNAGAGFLAHLFISKYVDHLPFYRQIQIFIRQQNLKLASSTLNDWHANTCKLLYPLHEELKRTVLQSPYIQIDESPIKVLTKNKPGSTHKGWMWAYHSPPDKLVLFDYRQGRDKSGPKEMLNGFSGIIQTDGYAAYNQFVGDAKILLAACMAHVRRKFFEAKDENPDVCNFVLTKIRDLYDIERTIKEENYGKQEILQKRNEESAPITDELKKYFDKIQHQLLPKSLTGKAIAYTLSLWSRLILFLKNPHIQIDNNLIENTIRPLALGRKNYLFAGSHNGAERAAMMYSFFGSCKLQGIDPLLWLKTTLEKISEHKANKLQELLPGYQKNK
ncbi:MAG: IS66 family transposase [Desulfobacterales bacterium]|nr:IS66 family transposase [Desulfobacterales bacterium]